LKFYNGVALGLEAVAVVVSAVLEINRADGKALAEQGQSSG